MSRSNPNLTNPAKHFFEWKGGEGKLQFYDKEKKETINVPLPFEFLPLDKLAKIVGYNKMAKKSFYSNEVRNSAKEEFTVKLAGQTQYTGLYKNEQGVPQVPRGASYAQSVYIAHKTKTGEYIIGNITMAGSALGAWIEFTQKNVVENGKVIMKQGEKQEAATGPFYPPAFTYAHIDKDENDIAIELDKELQIFLNQYLSSPKVEDTGIDNHVDQSVGTATPDQLADFEKRKSEKMNLDSDPLDKVFNPDEYDQSDIPSDWQ